MPSSESATTPPSSPLLGTTWSDLINWKEHAGSGYTDSAGPARLGPPTERIPMPTSNHLTSGGMDIKERKPSSSTTWISSTENLLPISSTGRISSPSSPKSSVRVPTPDPRSSLSPPSTPLNRSGKMTQNPLLRSNAVSPLLRKSKDKKSSCSLI